MTIYLEHPKHGRHVLSYGDDEQAMTAAGWRRCEPAQKAAPADVSAPVINALPVRRGRPRKAA